MQVGLCCRVVQGELKALDTAAIYERCRCCEDTFSMVVEAGCLFQFAMCARLCRVPPVAEVCWVLTAKNGATWPILMADTALFE